MHRLLLNRLGIVAVAAVAAVLAASVTPARADALNPCHQHLEQPFLPWADPASYVLAPDGAFEAGGGGWDRARGAALVAENEPYYVHSGGDATALQLPSGSSASSATLCVSLTHPTLRLFARNTGSATSLLRVEILYRDLLGLERSATVGLLPGTAQWQPTPVLPLLANLQSLPLVTDGTTQVALRFAATGNAGNWTIDDVYVDPYQGR